MKITADTNLLLRLVMDDEDRQVTVTVRAMESASLVAISVHSLCELVWVLAGKNAMPRNEIAVAIRGLVERKNVVINRPAVEAGLAVLDAGGNFADGVIAFEGRWLGADTFVSFDQKAVKILDEQDVSARLLS